MSARIKRGFTLIELLLIIAIIGVLAAVVAAAVNPAQKMKKSGDAKVRNDVGVIAGALQSYFTINGQYPAALSTLETSGEMTKLPAAPTNPTGYAAYTAGYSTCSSNASAAISGTIQAGNPTTNVLFCWRSSTGTAIDAATCACP